MCLVIDCFNVYFIENLPKMLDTSKDNFYFQLCFLVVHFTWYFLIKPNGRIKLLVQLNSLFNVNDMNLSFC